MLFVHPVLTLSVFCSLTSFRLQISVISIAQCELQNIKEKRDLEREKYMDPVWTPWTLYGGPFLGRKKHCDLFLQYEQKFFLLFLKSFFSYQVKCEKRSVEIDH